MPNQPDHEQHAAYGLAFDDEVASVRGFRTNTVPRILLVDQPAVLDELFDALDDASYQLFAAAGSAEAIAHLSKLRFDLVVLGLDLGHGQAAQLADFIEANGLELDLVVQSRGSALEPALEFWRRGAAAYLRAPYPLAQLRATVAEVLHRRRLQQAQREMAWRLECSEKLHRYLIDSSPDIIYTLNADGYFSFVNARVQPLLGYAPDELIGKHYSVLVHEADLGRARCVFRERRAGGRASRNVELRLRYRDVPGSAQELGHNLMSISFNSSGMYAGGTVAGKFFGTYGVARDVTESKRAEQLISHQAYHDILTDLPNRALFRDRLNLALIQARRNKSELAVMFVDLDRFKLVNDTLGHVKGDQLLRQVAARLRARLREGDTLARMGGDEFTLLLPDLRDKQDAALIAEQIVASLTQAFMLDENEVHVSASVGIAICPDDGDNVDELIRHADIAMYKVKASGKNGHRFYDKTMQDASDQKAMLERSLRRALEAGELEMYYQPQIDLASGRIVGAEGLLRWHHPQRGVLAAAEFLPCAEESGLIIPLSEWMLDPLCRDLQEWNRVAPQPVRLSLNLSPHYLDRGGFARKLGDALEKYGLSASQIEVEITENVCIRNPQYAIEQLRQLSQIGVSIAIDDFGTGYSSLSSLHRFPVQTIKIDQSFVREITQEDGHYPVALAIISIARGLGLSVIAEGVETLCQSHYLEQAGCRLVQGHHYAPALPQHEFVQLLQEHGTHARGPVQAVIPWHS